MAEKNSLWKNIRANRGSGRKPTREMLRQEKKIKAQKADGGPVGDDELYNMSRAVELGYTPDETGHWPSVDSETGMFLKSKEHPTAWMEYLHGHTLNPELNRTTNVVVNPEGYFGDNQLQYIPKKQYAEGSFVGEDENDIPYRPLSMPMEGYEWKNRPITKSTYDNPKSKKEVKSNSIPVNKQGLPYKNLREYEVSASALPKDYSEPKYVAERSTTATKNTPGMSTSGKEASSLYTQDYLKDTAKNIKVGLDIGQFTPAAPIAYGLSLPFTAYDVASDLYSGQYNRAGVDALGFIPGANAARRVRNTLNSADLLNDIAGDKIDYENLNNNPVKKAEGGYYPTQGPGKALFKGYAKGGYMYPDGGKVKPIYVIDRNDPRLKAYNDSLSLYDRYMDLKNMALNTNSGTRAQVARRYNIQQGPSNRVFRLNGVNNNYMLADNTNNVNTNILPTAAWSYQNSSNAARSGRFLAEYKKPVQPVEYKKPDPSPDLPSGEYLQRKKYMFIQQEEQELPSLVNTVNKEAFKPSKVLLREMGNIRKYNKGEPYKKSYEMYMDDGNKWRTISNEEYEMYKNKYPGADTPQGWIRNNQKAHGGYMYYAGGTYANNQGVIMGPVKTEEGYLVPKDSETGMPVVNMPEFEVISTGDFSKPNPYSPVTGSEFLNSGFNPLNLLLPNVEREQQPIDPRTGMKFPASGRVAPDYTLDLAFLGAKPSYANFEKGVNNVGKNVEKYGKRVLRSNYNPLSIPVKNIGTRIARISDSQYRENSQILDALKGKSESRYFGQYLNQDDYSNIKYGVGDRDLVKTYFKGDKTGLKKLAYNSSKDPGLNPSKNWYGNLDSYELNSEIPHGENLNILDFLKSMNRYKWNEEDGFKTGQYVLSEGIENLMKDYPGENLLNLGKLTGNKQIGLEDFNDEQLKVVKDNLRHLFEKYGSDRIPFEIGRNNKSIKGETPNYKGFQLFNTPVKPIDDIAGHMGFLERNPVTEDINYTTRDIWGFNPRSYTEKYYAGKKGKVKPFSAEALQVHLMDAFGKPFVLHQTNPIKFKDGGPINPYSYYSGGSMEYGRGGNFLKHLGAGAYSLGEGMLDTVTMGATDQLTDKGFEYLTKVGNKNLDLNNPDDVKFLKTQQKVKGYSNTAGAIGTAVATGNVQGAISQGTKGLNTAFQATDGLSDDFKQWSQGISGVAGMASGFAGGLNSDSFTAAAKAGTGAAGFGKDVSKFAGVGNTAMGFIPGANDAPLWQQGEQRQDYLNSPEYLAMKERENQQYVNQGLSFEQGGNINNNSLNLQNSMRGKYNSYRKRYSKGGTFQKFGINEIPDSSGLHHENAYGGVPIGPNAMAEGGEFVLDNNYVVSDEVDGQNSQTDEFGRTMAENLKRDLSKYTMRDLNSKNRDGLRRPMDPLAQETINQIKQNAIIETEMARAEAQAKEQERQAMVEGALQYAAAGGKLNKDITKIVEEEYAAAYGGQINPKKYKGLNMPGYSKGGKLPKEVLRARVESHMSPQEADAYVNQYSEGGDIHIKESKKGTFTAAATKHGKSVQEFARQVLANKGNYSAAMIKKANFARNASKWKHAQGGPVVSNVNQDFDLYAQNRGGMMMANGGMMQQQGSQDQMMQLIQAYAQAMGISPEEIIQQLQQMEPQDQQQAIQQMAQELQGGQQQGMARGGYFNGKKQYFRGGEDVFGPITEAEAIANGYQPPYQDEIDYTQIPNFNTPTTFKNLASLKLPTYSNDNLQLPNNKMLPTSPISPADMSIYNEDYVPGIDADGREVSWNPAMLEDYDENNNKIYVNPNTLGTDFTNTKQQINNNSFDSTTPWYEEPLYSKAARYGQAIPGVIASITALQNKKRKLPYRNLDAQTVNYEPERIIDKEESRRRFNTFADRMKNIASGAGMLAGNLRGTLLGSNKELAGRIAESVMREKNTNAQLAQQTAMTQFGANRETDALNEQMFQNAQTQAIAGLQDTTGKLAGAAGEERKQYLQEWIAKNKLKTRDFIQGPDGSYYYEAPDGTLTKV